MNINNVGNVSAALGQAGTGDAVAIAVLKKAIDIEAQSAMQLIQALPLPMASNPPNMGNAVDTYA